MRLLLVLLGLLPLIPCLLQEAAAQDRPIRRPGEVSRPQGDAPTPANRPLEGVYKAPDSLRVLVYHAGEPAETHPYPDTLLGNYTQQPDPARQRLVDYAHLGSLGTPARPLLFHVPEYKGFHLGFRQFDLYRRGVDSIRYFKVNRTFTDAYYSQENTKDDFILKTMFTRNVGEEWTLTIDYLRIAHLGRYTHQKSRHTDFTINSSYRPKGGRYQGYMSYTFWDFQQEDNGGVSDFTLFNDNFYNDRANIPVFSESGQTQTQGHDLSYTHYFNLLPTGKDSTGNDRRRRLTVGHQFLYSPGNYKFYDTRPDTLFYGDLQVDDRGLRQYLRWHKVENKFELSTHKPPKEKGAPPRDLFGAGIIHSYQGTYQEPADTSVNNLFLFGEWAFRPMRFLSLNSYALYGIGNSGSDYVVRGELRIDIGKGGLFDAKIQNQRHSPDLLHKRLYISKREVYNNDFAKPISTSFEAGYRLPLTGTGARVGYHLLNNHIYYDTLSHARQAGQAISVLQLVLRQDFRFGVFGMENTAALQRANSDVVRLPALALKNSIFVEGKIFKKVMLARLGFDFRLNTSYYAPAYQPVTGQYHLQDDLLVETYPALDLFLSFKVQTVRAFAKLENIPGWFIPEMHYLTPGHPLPDPQFRFGLSWRFID